MVSRSEYYALEDEHDMFERILIQLKFKFAKASAELEDVTQDLKVANRTLEAKNYELDNMQQEMHSLLEEKGELEEALGYRSKTSNTDVESNASSTRNSEHPLTDR